MLTTTADKFLAPRNAKAAWEMITIREWNSTRPEDINPAERCMCRKVLKETRRISARKLRFGPRNSGIKLTSERLAARMPAFARPRNPKPRQTGLLPMYTSWIKTSTRVHGPQNLCRRTRYAYFKYIKARWEEGGAKDIGLGRLMRKKSKRTPPTAIAYPSVISMMSTFENERNIQYFPVEWTN